jgi:acetyltransferase-like isoleucine patch superfamily enzyme
MNEHEPSLHFDQIKEKYWCFFLENGHVGSEFFSFLPDGTIGGYDNDNERYWRIEDGVLSLLDKDQEVSVTFDSVEVENGKVLLKGKHLPNPELLLCLREKTERFQFNATKSALAAEIETLGWTVGDHSYGVPEFFEKGRAKLVIGKYCSIATGVKIAFENHRTDTFTMYPFKALRQYWQHVPRDVQDHISKGDVVIGSDVWIGADVFIGSGVTIGSGAAIGANSVVVKDVPPYAIVAGNPGRVVRYRFEPHLIEELLELCWWDLDDEAVDALLPLLMASDAPALLAALRQAKAASGPPGAG